MRAARTVTAPRVGTQAEIDPTERDEVMRQFYAQGISVILLAALLVLTSCNMPRGDLQTTPDITQAYQTVQARLTQGVQGTPAATIPVSPTATTAQAAALTPTAGEAAPSATPRPTTIPPTGVAKLCDQAGAGSPLDVTIPDGTKMTPGQTFTKTWRLVNIGTCTWSTDYTVALFSGEDMDAPAGVNLTRAVPPGESIDVSVELAAPTNKTGTLRGNWKLRNTAGNWFGIGPGGASPFWVEISVAGSAETPTATTSAGTPYPGGTPTGAVSGSASLAPGQVINLDTGGVDTAGNDLMYKLTQAGRLTLSPQGMAAFAVGAFNAPSLEDCRGASLSNSAMPLKELSAGQYICYKTDQGFYGIIRLISLDVTNNQLTLQYNTWLSP